MLFYTIMDDPFNKQALRRLAAKVAVVLALILVALGALLRWMKAQTMIVGPIDWWW